jgi:ribosome-associated toxin RatA of RatAB toxin-antitoxin module
MNGGFSVAAVKITQLFKGSIDQVFKGIGSYTLYPEHIPGVQKIEVLPPKLPKSTCQVRYEINVIKTFYYVIDMFEESPKKIWWTMSESNLMKSNSGQWDLKEVDKNTTEATYTLDVAFKGFVPGAVTDRVAKANLPAMMAGFQKIIEQSAK